MKDIVSEEKYSLILTLQEEINTKLRLGFEANKDKGREHLSSYLISLIENIMEELNAAGHSFSLINYEGDLHYENSEQDFSDGKEMGKGITIHFHGFSAQLVWVGSDKYQNINSSGEK